MARIVPEDAQAWAEGTKLTIAALEDDLLEQVEDQVLARLATVFDVDDWDLPTTTPSLVRSIIAMTYVSWLYSKTYSEDVGGSNEYALRLLAMAESNIIGALNGTIELVDTVVTSTVGGPALFYPTDASSALEANRDDMSLGGPKFTMGTIW